jgi:ABC-type transport system involved in multi-copper enzyme maturation permease subunit
MKILRQILAIARTEIRFGFRRGAPVVTTILIGLIFGAGILMGPLANLSIAREDMNRILQDHSVLERLEEKGLTVEIYKNMQASSMAEISVLSMPLAWQILLITTLLFLPVVAATIMPADRQSGTAELLYAQPMTGWTYFAGKALGLFLTILLCSLIPFGLFLVVFETALQVYMHVNLPLDIIGFYLQFAVFDWLPMVLWAVIFGILAGIPFRSRKAAIFPGLTAGILSIFLWMVVFKAPALPFFQLDLTTYYLIQNYHPAAWDAFFQVSGLTPPALLGEGGPVLGISKVIIGDMLLISGLVIVGSFSRLWLGLRENF